MDFDAAYAARKYDPNYKNKRLASRSPNNGEGRQQIADYSPNSGYNNYFKQRGESPDEYMGASGGEPVPRSFVPKPQSSFSPMQMKDTMNDRQPSFGGAGPMASGGP